MQSIILQWDSSCWPQIRDNQRVLELWVCAWIEAVHSTETLAGRPTTEHLHITLLWQLLSKRVGLLSGHHQFQKDIAVFCENCGAWIVQPEGLSGRIPHLYGPMSLWDTWYLGKDQCKIHINTSSLNGFCIEAQPAWWKPSDRPPQPENTSSVRSLGTVGSCGSWSGDSCEADLPFPLPADNHDAQTIWL